MKNGIACVARRVILASALALAAFWTGSVFADLGDVGILKDCPQTCTAPDGQCPKKCNIGKQSSCNCETVGVACNCVEQLP